MQMEIKKFNVRKHRIQKIYMKNKIWYNSIYFQSLMKYVLYQVVFLWGFFELIILCDEFYLFELYNIFQVS